ncbi:MAG TPA: tRNA pseudouridine(55) synthase TruB [Marmoricola sp.]
MGPTAGLVVVDKPAGITSHDVVSRVRRLAGTRKVGHAGTLDPMATGVLLVGVNRATRLLGHLMLTDKAYDATIRLGAATLTDDAEGEVLRESPTDGVTEESVRAGLAAMVGEIEQRPSAVSAIKVDGRRAYDRVRAGEQVDLPARSVRIDAIDVTRMALPEVDVSVRCSSGTYIRAVARDLGEGLGVGGHLTALRRTAVGPFTLAESRGLEDLAADFTVLPIAEVARRCFDSLDLDDAQAAAVRVGRPLQVRVDGEGAVAVFAPDGEFLALYESFEGGIRPVAVFV